MYLFQRLLGEFPAKEAKIEQTHHEEPHDSPIRTHSSARPATEKNWLCPYGPERIDEALRFSNIAVPERIEFKMTELADASNLTWAPISLAAVLALMRGKKQQWDRITLPSYDPVFFELLRLHPCEELRLEFEDVVLTRADVLNIGKCTALRLFDMGSNSVSAEDLRFLQNLPKLEKLMYDRRASAFSCIEALQKFQMLTMLPVNASGLCSLNSPGYPFADNEMTKALSSVLARKDTIRELHLSITVGPTVFDVLGQLTQLESIFVEGSMKYQTESDLNLLFMSPNVQMSVRYMHLSHMDVHASVLPHLPKFKNLRSIDVRCVNISITALLALLRASADHLEALTISHCRAVGDALLDGIACCKKLQLVEIYETAVTAEAVEKYRKAKQPFWQNLVHKDIGV